MPVRPAPGWYRASYVRFSGRPQLENARPIGERRIVIDVPSSVNCLRLARAAASSSDEATPSERIASLLASNVDHASSLVRVCEHSERQSGNMSAAAMTAHIASED
jgi:hypothetical protein